MAAVKIPLTQRLILYDVSWQTYGKLLRAFQDRRLRLTYDRGVLEIMTLSFEHEGSGSFLGRLAITLTEELGLPIKQGGSTTFRRRSLVRGFTRIRRTDYKGFLLTCTPSGATLLTCQVTFFFTTTEVAP